MVQALVLGLGPLPVRRGQVPDSLPRGDPALGKRPLQWFKAAMQFGEGEGMSPMGTQLAADGGRLWTSRPQLHPPGWADGVGPCLRALLRGCGAGDSRGPEGCDSSRSSLRSQPLVEVDVWHFVPVLGHNAVPQLRLQASQREGAAREGDRE